MIRSTRITQNTQSIPIILITPIILIIPIIQMTPIIQITRSSPITPISPYASVKSIVRRSIFTAATCTRRLSPKV